MKAIIIIGICILIVLTGCYQPDIEQIAKDWEEVGYNKGVNRGIEICEDNYKPMLKQFEPLEGCMMLLKGNHIAQNICEGDEYYNALR